MKGDSLGEDHDGRPVSTQKRQDIDRRQVVASTTRSEISELEARGVWSGVADSKP